MHSMKKTYGEAKGERVFHASIQKGKLGSEKWHGSRGAMKSLKKRTGY